MDLLHVGTSLPYLRMCYYGRKETIAAITTPPGEGGVAIVRLSGERALAIAGKMFAKPIEDSPSHTVHFGEILSAEGEVLDEGLLLIMKKPRSYTGEDVVELQCHGGTILSKNILEAAYVLGASPALPGEFTFRAFQNGKIDLAKAEAVQEVIAAKNEFAQKNAFAQLQGRLSQKITHFQKKIVEIAALLEAWVDFPEEGLEFMSQKEIQEKLLLVKNEMHLLLSTFADGRIANTLPSLALLGAPNVGKSSLLNLLAGEERAIVTPLPGTTRDLIEEEIEIDSLRFLLADTAGVRETEDLIEQEGIKRSYHALASADLVLLLLDLTNPSSFTEELLSVADKKRTILVWNKSDLPHLPPPLLPFPYQVILSVKEESGIEKLKETINHVLSRKKELGKEEVLLTKERHYEALKKSVERIDCVLLGLETLLSPEFLLSDIRFALQALSTIIGMDVTEEVLEAIFSTFCIGK